MSDTKGVVGKFLEESGDRDRSDPVEVLEYAQKEIGYPEAKQSGPEYWREVYEELDQREQDIRSSLNKGLTRKLGFSMKDNPASSAVVGNVALVSLLMYTATNETLRPLILGSTNAGAGEISSPEVAPFAPLIAAIGYVASKGAKNISETYIELDQEAENLGRAKEFVEDQALEEAGGEAKLQESSVGEEEFKRFYRKLSDEHTSEAWLEGEPLSRDEYEPALNTVFGTSDIGEEDYEITQMLKEVNVSEKSRTYHLAAYGGIRVGGNLVERDEPLIELEATVSRDRVDDPVEEGFFGEENMEEIEKA